jgi:TonB family protein
MTACASIARPSAPLEISAGVCRKRLAAAVIVSALLHGVAATSFTGKSGARAGAEQRQPFSAHLSYPAPPVVAAADPTPARRHDEPSPPRPQHEPRSSPAARQAPLASTPRAPAPGASHTGAALAEAPDLTYYGARQLDVFPALSSKLELGAVAAARGRALLLVLIDATGAVNDVSLVEASPAAVAEDDMKRALTATRFTPAYRNGRAVRSRMLIEVSYGAEERGNRDGGS